MQKVPVINTYISNNNVHKADSTEDALKCRHWSIHMKKEYFKTPFLIQDRSKGQK